MTTTTTAKRIRRAPAQLLSDLKAQRQAVAERQAAKLAKLDAKIAQVEARYHKSIALAELAGCSSEELVNELANAKRQARLLRTALKAKR